MTQPEIIRSFQDEFEINNMSVFSTPVAPREASIEENNSKYIAEIDIRSWVGKLLYLEKWSRPDIQNVTREFSKFMNIAIPAHEKSTERVMTYCVKNKEVGLEMKPVGEWNGIDKSYKFKIRGMSDSDFAKDCQGEVLQVTLLFSTMRWLVTKSQMQESVSFLVIEAELTAATSCLEEMIFIKNAWDFTELQVKLLMLLEVNNKGVVDIVNNSKISTKWKGQWIKCYPNPE
jgi:hypothetical protein